MDGQTNNQPAVSTDPVPLLDLSRENGPLADQFRDAFHRVIQSGRFVLGPDVHDLEEQIASYCGARHAIGCASGSDALLLALMSLEIGPGDEVILPSFTFFATASAVTRLGATPVFVDIRPDTMNIDPQKVAAAVTPRTKVILPVHLFGQCADMDPLVGIANQHQLMIVEDCAQAIGARYDGQGAGAIGDIGTFSFYPTKNLGGFGDGGLLTTNDDELALKLRLARAHGMQPRYYHETIGINSRLDTLQAAVLRVKLAHLPTWTRQRQDNAKRYQKLFHEAGLDDLVQTPAHDERCEHVWNQFTVRVRDGQRDALRLHLTAANVGTEIYYPIPLHRQPCFGYLNPAGSDLVETEKAASEVLSLPIFAAMTRMEQDTVVHHIREFFRGSATEQAVPKPHFVNRQATSTFGPR